MANKFLGLDSINVLKQYIDERIVELNKRSRLMTIQAYTYCETGKTPQAPTDGVGGFDINGLTIVYPNGWYSLKTLLNKFEDIEKALAEGSIWMSAGVYEGTDNKLGPNVKIEYTEGEEPETIVKLTDKITWSIPVKINGQNGISTRMKYTYSNDVLTTEEIKLLRDYPGGVSPTNRIEYLWSQSGEDDWQGPTVWATYSENATNVLWRYCITNELVTPAKPTVGDSTWSKNLINQNLSKDYPYMWMSFQIVPAGSKETDGAWSDPILFGHWGMDGADGADGAVPDYTVTLYRKGNSNPEISDLEGIIQPAKPAFIEDAIIDDYIVDGWSELPGGDDIIVYDEPLMFNGIDTYDITDINVLDTQIMLDSANDIWYSTVKKHFIGINSPKVYEIYDYISGSSHGNWYIDTTTSKPDWTGYNIIYSDTYGFIRTYERTLYTNSTVPDEYKYESGISNYYRSLSTNKVYTWDKYSRNVIVEFNGDLSPKYSYKFNLNGKLISNLYEYNPNVKRDFTNIRDNKTYVWYEMELINKDDMPTDVEDKLEIWWQCTIKVNGRTNKVMKPEDIGSVKRYNAIDGTSKPGRFTLNLYAWSETQLQPEMSEELVGGWRPSNYNYLPDRPLELTTPEASLWMITANVEKLDEDGIPVINGSWSEPVKITGPRGPIAYDYRIETRYNIGTADKPQSTPQETEWSKTVPQVTAKCPYVWANNYLVCYKMKYGNDLDPNTGEYNIIPADNGTVIESYNYYRLTGLDGEDGNRKNSLDYGDSEKTVNVTSFSETNLYIANSEDDITYNIELDSLAFINGYTGKFANIGNGSMIINSGDYKFSGSCIETTSIVLLPMETIELVCYNSTDNKKLLLVIGKDISE